MPKKSLNRRDFAKSNNRVDQPHGTDSSSFVYGTRTSGTSPPLVLSSEARAIVEAGHRYIEVLACAGSGKTTVLCNRISSLVAGGVSPSQIQALSFSQAASAEMRQRLSRFPTRRPSAASALGQVSVSTCHAFGNALLSNTGKQTPKLLTPTEVSGFLARAAKTARNAVASNAAMCTSDRVTAREFLAALKTEHRLQPVAKLFEYAAASHQSLAALTKNLPTFSALAAHVVALRLLRVEYRRLKAKESKIDYADMLKLSADTLTKKPNKRGKSSVGQRKILPAIRHLLVDEYQDSSPAQVRLIAALAHALPDLSITVFGDEHQSIFRFAGALHTPLSSVLPDVVAMPLSRSYRLTQPNAAAATAILRAAEPSVRRIVGRRLTANAAKPVLVKTGSWSSQLHAVARDIAARLEGGANPSQIAVLARTKAVLREVEAQLLERGIAANQKGVDRNTRHVLNVLQLVRWVERSHSGARLPTISDLRSALPGVIAAAERWERLRKALPKIINPSFDGRYTRCADLYLIVLGGVRADKERRDEVRRWIPHCRNYADARAMQTALAALHKCATVTLSTIHQAKGSEWDHVYVVGVADGQMPIYLAGDLEDALVEERNLLHVAITRSRMSVRLYYAAVKHARSHKKFDSLSRFLDAPEVLHHFEIEHR